MKAAVLALFVSAVALCADAQVTATVGTAADGSTEVTLRNEGALPLEAYAMRLPYRTQQSAVDSLITVYRDPAVDPRQASLQPGAEFKLIADDMVASAKRVHPLFAQPVVAGIFADGSTTGDAGLLTLLMLRRSNMLAAVETTLETLTDAGRRGTPPAQVAQRFRDLAGGLRRWYLPREQTVGLSLYESIISKLTGLPAERPDEPSPLSTLVAAEAPGLLRQRAALLDARPGLGEVTIALR